MSGDTIPIAMAKVIELGLLLGAGPLNKHPACWELQVDARWWLAFNGHKEPRASTDGGAVPPFCVLIKYNGWPAGVLDFGGGLLAAGDGANEDTFIAALDARIALCSRSISPH